MTSTAVLMRWLGPWASAAAVPDTYRREVEVPRAGRAPLKLWVYGPRSRRAHGTYVFVHGFNPWGPADRRSDRFTRILAHSGFVVVAPFLDELIDLHMVGHAGDDLQLAVDHCQELTEHRRGTRPSLFGLSFGSLPTLQVASRAPDSVAGTVVYGGYADPVATVRYAAGLAPPRPDVLSADPLSRPGVISSLDARAGRPDSPVRSAWRYFVESTWGRLDMHEVEAFESFARQIAATLDGDDARRFLTGCGLGDDAEAFFERIVGEAGDMADLDPRPGFDAIRCPLRVMHGMDDRVIPWTEQETLLAGFASHPDVRHYRTGIFDHTRVHTPLELIARGPQALGDLRTLTAMAGAIAEIGHLA